MIADGTVALSNGRRFDVTTYTMYTVGEGSDSTLYIECMTCHDTVARYITNAQILGWKMWRIIERIEFHSKVVHDGH